MKKYCLILLCVVNFHVFAQSDIKYGFEFPDAGWAFSTSDQLDHQGSIFSGFLTGNYKRIGINLGFNNFAHELNDSVPSVNGAIEGVYALHFQVPLLFYFDIINTNRIKLGLGYQFAFGRLILQNDVANLNRISLASSTPVALVRFRLISMTEKNYTTNERTPKGELKLVGRLGYNYLMYLNSNIPNHSMFSATLGLEFLYFKRAKSKKSH